MLGHMSEGPVCSTTVYEYFIHQHGVLKEKCSTTKWRVDFNALSPTSTGDSQNDIKAVGCKMICLPLFLGFAHILIIIFGQT